MDVSELMKIKDLRVMYIQVDSMNKCIPQDWFLGYDQFAVYTFLNLQDLKNVSLLEGKESN